jgi:hypothetical protein
MWQDPGLLDGSAMTYQRRCGLGTRRGTTGTGGREHGGIEKGSNFQRMEMNELKVKVLYVEGYQIPIFPTGTGTRYRSGNLHSRVNVLLHMNRVNHGRIVLRFQSS